MIQNGVKRSFDRTAKNTCFEFEKEGQILFK